MSFHWLCRLDNVLHRWRDRVPRWADVGFSLHEEMTWDFLTTGTVILYEVILEDIMPGAANKCTTAARAESGLSLVVKDISHIAVFNSR